MSKPIRYRVKDIFYTLQGEGYHAGTAALFIRFVGCNVWSGYPKDRQADYERTGAACALFCDTDFTKEGSKWLTAEELAEYARQYVPYKHTSSPLVVFTGGEPLLQLRDELLIALMRQNFHRFAVETNGLTPIPDCLVKRSSWRLHICCSPKLADVAKWKIQTDRIDELKLVVPSYDPSYLPADLLRGIRHKYLQPEDGPNLRANQQHAVKLVQAFPEWRLSLQTHKVLDLP